MLWRRLSVRVWGLGLLVIVVSGAVAYLVLARGAKLTITETLLRRQQIIARAEAANITSFFQVFGDSLAVFAQLSSMKGRDARTLEDMNVFVEQWRDSNLVGGIVLTDNQGKVRLNANVLGTHDVGILLADRDYFAWAKVKPEAGEYFLGEPVISRLGATKGQLIVPVAGAVYDGESGFVGALTASVKLKPLTERYLALMKVSDQTDVYLTNEQGELLYSSSVADAVGSSVFELLPELKNKLNQAQEGRLQTREYLTAYSPLLLGNRNWWLIVVSPVQDVIDLAVPIFVRQVLVLLLVACSMVLFGVVAARDAS